MSKDLTLKLSRPILSASGKDEILEITRKKDDDISATDFLDMELTAKLSSQLPIICNLYNLTEKQVGSLHPKDFMSLVAEVGKFIE